MCIYIILLLLTETVYAVTVVECVSSCELSSPSSALLYRLAQCSLHYQQVILPVRTNSKHLLWELLNPSLRTLDMCPDMMIDILRTDVVKNC